MILNNILYLHKLAIVGSTTIPPESRDYKCDPNHAGIKQQNFNTPFMSFFILCKKKQKME